MIQTLLDIMARLRDPNTGCPWDVKQTFASIAPYTIEEAYEVADAIAREDYAELKDELGDLLLQVVFHSQMAAEAGHFHFADVVAAINDKMRRRHPHVFATDATQITDEHSVKHAWETQKTQERAAKQLDGVLDGVALALPALKRAQKLQKRAANVGFDWQSLPPVLAQLSAELDELNAAIEQQDSNACDEELGDVLFSCVNLARHLRIDAEDSLRKANHKFEQRVQMMETLAAAKPLPAHTVAELEQLWQQAKRKLKSTSQDSARVGE